MKKTETKDIFKFAVYFLAIFSITFAFLYLFGLVPDELKVNNVKYPQKKVAQNIESEVPVRIVISKINLDAQIYNPEKNDIETLDGFLSKGAVRYPGSGYLGNGNMLLFGHSSYLKVVNNQAYRTFNGIQNLKVGDEIKVYSKNDTFVYKVNSVKTVGADEALVNFSSNKDMLTLSTCDSFGTKGERYVVEADLI